MRPKLLMLDTIALDAVERLREFADVDDGRQYPPALVSQRIGEYDGLIIKSGNRIGRDLLSRAKRLKVIGRAGSGTDNIDLDTAHEMGVTVITSPAGNACSVAEYVVCTALLLCHQFIDAHRGAQHNDFRRASWQGRNLAALTVGVVGTGHIGLAVIEKLVPLAGRVLASGSSSVHRRAVEDRGAGYVDDLAVLLGSSDIVTLHVPLTDATRRLLDATAFARMRPGTLLINSARGELIDDEALLTALRTGTVGAAALDTVHPDPPFGQPPEYCQYSHYWVHHPRVFYTPHIAAGTQDALQDVASRLVDALERFFTDSPKC
ncbi:NAD(P)-dependent oxidoreductase [Streptomyces sp. NPDC005408]|uniref:NAD(P)-dependent oxidoreductase n=1 Tax=Streptomyces sp. NPDC005408 TaxID=3155341 RepID=UPI0033ACBD33